MRVIRNFFFHSLFSFTWNREEGKDTQGNNAEFCKGKSPRRWCLSESSETLGVQNITKQSCRGKRAGSKIIRKRCKGMKCNRYYMVLEELGKRVNVPNWGLGTWVLKCYFGLCLFLTSMPCFPRQVHAWRWGQAGVVPHGASSWCWWRGMLAAIFPLAAKTWQKFTISADYCLLSHGSAHAFTWWFYVPLLGVSP